jgi:hypothetical protein
MPPLYVGWKRTYYKEKKKEVLVVDTEEVGLEVNAYKTKYMVMSRDWIARLRHSINNAVVPLKGLNSSLKNEKSIQEKLRVD